MSYEVKDINLYPSGEHKIDWVRKNCPLLRSLEEDFKRELPFKGVRIALSIHEQDTVEKDNEQITE